MNYKTLGAKLAGNFSMPSFLDLAQWHAHQANGVSTAYTKIPHDTKNGKSQLQKDLERFTSDAQNKIDKTKPNFKKHSLSKQEIKLADRKLNELTDLNIELTNTLNQGLLEYVNNYSINSSIYPNLELYKSYKTAQEKIHEVYQDCIINGLPKGDDDFHKRNIVFRQIINDLTSLVLLHDNGNGNGAKESFDNLSEKIAGKFPALTLSELFSKARCPNIEKIKYFLNQYELYTNYHTNIKYDEHHKIMQKVIDKYMLTDYAGQIKKDYEEQSWLILNEILKSPKYKTIHKITRELQNSLLFSGVELEHTTPRKKNGLNFMLDYIFGLPAKGIQLGMELYNTDKYKGFTNASTLNKASRIREAYQESSIKAWQHQHASHRYKLHTQAHFEIFLDKLFAELSENPYLYAKDKNSILGKIDNFKDKQQTRIYRDFSIAINEFNVYLEQYNQIKDYIQSENETPPKTQYEKNTRENKYAYWQKTNFELFQQTVKQLLDNLNKIEQQHVFNFSSELEAIQSNLNEIIKIKFNVQEYADHIKEINACKLLLENNAKNPTALLCSKSNTNNLDSQTIAKINSAIYEEQKENLAYYIAELHKTNNSANFKQALSTTIKTLNGMLSEKYKTLGKDKIRNGFTEINAPSLEKNGKLDKALRNLRDKKNFRELPKGVHQQYLALDNALTKSKAKVKQALPDNPVGKVMQYSANGLANLIYGAAKTGVFTQDIILNLTSRIPDAALSVKDGVVNLSRILQYSGIELFNHGLGLSYLVKELAHVFSACGVNNVIGLYAADNFFDKNKKNHQAKMQNGSLSGYVRIKQQNKDIKRAVNELDSIINITHAVNFASNEQEIMHNKLEFHLTIDRLKQDLRYSWQSTNMPLGLQQNMIIDPLYNGTLARTISHAIKKIIPIGNTQEQKQIESQNFLSLLYGGEYINQNYDIIMPDQQMLIASLNVLLNDSPLSTILGNSITATFLPLKIASNFLGGYLAATTGNPFFIFLNMPGNPLDDIFVATVSLIMSLPVLAVSYPLIEKFYGNQRKIIQDISEVLYTSSKQINYIANNSASMITQVLSLGQIFAENNIDFSIISSKEALDEQISKIKDPQQKLEIQKLINNSTHQLVANSLPQDLDNNQIANLALLQERVPQVADTKAVAVMMPYAKDLFHTLPEEIQYKIINNGKTSNFAANTKQIVMNNIGNILSSIMEHNGANMIIPASMPIYSALSLLYALAASGIDISEFSVRKILNKQVKFSLTDTIKISAKRLGKQLSEKNAQRMKKDRYTSKVTGLPVAKDMAFKTQQPDGTTPKQQVNIRSKGYRAYS